MSRRARVASSLRSKTSAPLHHGRNSGYRSQRSTSSNMDAQACGTITDLRTVGMGADGRIARRAASIGFHLSIVDNKKAFHDYFIEERYEAGMVLEGWEVKAIRAGRANI